MNNDWNKLKKSSSGVPTHSSLLPYILKVLENKEEVLGSDIGKKVVEYLQVPEEIVNIMYPNFPNSEGVLLNRVSFALSDLYKAAAISRPRRAIYQITDLGLSLLKKYGDTLTKKILKEQPAYIKYEQELADRNERKGVDNKDIEAEELDIKQKVDEDIQKINNEVATELLTQIKNSDPYFFEKLVVDLLVAMGYSGENGKAEVTQKSNDGGIDGIINQDPLGTSTVYIQAKRYKEDNIVQRSAVQSFYGALAAVSADRGVFITTSSFTKGASEFAHQQGIVLIDGIQLTDLMLKYHVGVEVAKKYEVFKLDSDYFEFE